MTAPALTPVTCSVRVQGELLEDGSDPDTTAPVVLSGLQLTWGRGSTVDQPDAASASFTLEDRSGNQAFARLVALGRTVEISATGTTYADPDAGTFDDPAFDATALGALSHPGRPAPGDRVIEYWSGSTVDADPAGGRRLVCRVLPAYRSGAVSVIVAPRVLAPVGDVTAWDDIATPRPGQLWRQTIAAGSTAPGAVLYVRSREFDTPFATAPGGGAAMIGWDPARGAYSRDYSPGSDAWQGLEVVASPPGHSWATVPGTWEAAPAGWTWESMAGFTLDGVDVLAPAGETVREVLVFAGRITDADAQWDTGAGACMVEVTAADILAELGNRDVGAEPWGRESVAVRARRILDAGGRPDVVLYVDPGPAAQLVTRLDVDRQQVAGMLRDLATSVDAVFWAAAHTATGGYLWLEDMQRRAALDVLAEVGGVVVIVAGGGHGLEISACDIDLDPIHWVQSNSDVATRCAVDWLDQSGDPDPTGRTTQLVLAELEAPGAGYGVRRVQVTSQLTTEPEAAALAAGVLARLAPGATPWRIGGATYRVEPDADAGDVGAALALLDGTTRIGAPVRLMDLPAWSPVPAANGYLEGGTYHYDGGAWRLELTMSATAGVGASARWNELDPAWRWEQFDPAIRWLDLVGVGVGVADEGRIRL